MCLCEDNPCDYILFFDGDDRISMDYLENAYKHACVGESDIVIFSGMRMVMSNVSVPASSAINPVSNIMIPYDVFCKYIYSDKVGGQCWGKLIKLSLIKENVRFAEGMYEDVIFWYRLLDANENLVVNTDVSSTYWWMYNPKSIVNKKPSKQEVDNVIENLEWILNKSIEKFMDEPLPKEIYFRYTLGYYLVSRRLGKSVVSDLTRKEYFRASKIFSGKALEEANEFGIGG